MRKPGTAMLSSESSSAAGAGEDNGATGKAEPGSLEWRLSVDPDGMTGFVVGVAGAAGNAISSRAFRPCKIDFRNTIG